MNASKLIRSLMKPDTTQSIAERRKHIAACDQVRKEMEQRFPKITPENAKVALDWQESRIAELRNA